MTHPEGPFGTTKKSGLTFTRVPLANVGDFERAVFKLNLSSASERSMKVSLVWSSPKPERTIAVAMRRCYSTKVIEDIETELEQKGAEYWKFLLTKAMQDKSLDVLEHFTMTVLVEGLGEAEVGKLAARFPHFRALRLNEADWLFSMNARTLVELWRDVEGKGFAESVVSELDRMNVSPVFNSLAFGDRLHAN